jgi:hypothetical protein
MIIIINIKKIINYYKNKIKIKKLKKKDFIKVKLIFKLFNILIKRKYNKKIFFNFLNEVLL